MVNQWFTAFGTEALGNPPANPEGWAKGQIEKGHAFLWHDGQPVSMGCRIGQKVQAPKYQGEKQAYFAMTTQDSYEEMAQVREPKTIITLGGAQIFVGLAGL